MSLKATTLIAAALFVLASTIGQAQEFSADVVYSDAKTKQPSDNSHPASKLYVSGDRLRLDTNGLTGIILLTDRHENIAVVLQPAKKTIQPVGSGPSQYFRVNDPDDACSTWQSIAAEKIICEKVGPEVVNGRETVKYRNKSVSDTATNAVWIDKALKFVIKWQSADTGADLRNIKEEKLAEDLFAVPSTYKRASPQKGSSKGFSHK